MAGTLRFLSVFLLIFPLLPGCVTGHGPVQGTRKTVLPSSPPPPPGQGPAKKQAGPPGGEGPAVVSPPLPPPASCGSLVLSSRRSRLEFLISGLGVMKKSASLEAVQKRAEREAVARLIRCSGLGRTISGFYDRSRAPVPGDERRMARKIRMALGVVPRYRVLRESCREEGESRSCQVAIEGTVRRLRPDPRFVIRSSGVGKAGVLEDGEAMHVRFSLSRPATVYLFDVDEKGRGTLLFPGPLFGRTALPAGSRIVFPPEDQKAVTLVARLPAGSSWRLGHLFIVALAGRTLPGVESLVKNLRTDGNLPVVEDFFGRLLPELEHRAKGGDWSLRVIPYEIVRKGPSPPATAPGHH